jgi:hypothetical protein
VRAREAHLVVEREGSGRGRREARARFPRPEHDTTSRHGDDTMHTLPLSAFHRLWLSIAGLALSALCGSARIPTAPPAVASAAEVSGDALVFDCNQNGIEDSVDIALGASSDQNRNGVPDECEAAGRWIDAR